MILYRVIESEKEKLEIENAFLDDNKKEIIIKSSLQEKIESNKAKAIEEHQYENTLQEENGSLKKLMAFLKPHMYFKESYATPSPFISFNTSFDSAKEILYKNNYGILAIKIDKKEVIDINEIENLKKEVYHNILNGHFIKMNRLILKDLIKKSIAVPYAEVDNEKYKPSDETLKLFPIYRQNEYLTAKEIKINKEDVIYLPGYESLKFSYAEIESIFGVYKYKENIQKEKVLKHK